MVMSEQSTSPNRSQPVLTQHAMLVAWGVYAQQLGLVAGLGQVALRQKTRDHRPHTKVIEFLLAILAGLPHLQDLSRSAHPLDQDQAVAEAWGQPAWADYSGVSRTLQRLSQDEVDAIADVLMAVSQPFVDQEIQLALERSGRLVYDADLTGRPVSNTSTTYPDTAFGYMGDTVSLGYQAALVSVHSPAYGRLWLVNQLHPGDTVSSTQAQALVTAAEARTGVRPLRRTHLVADRLASAQAALAEAEARYETAYEKQRVAQGRVRDTAVDLTDWSRELRTLAADYERNSWQPTPHCKLSRARRKVTTYQKRLPRVQQALDRADRRLQRCGHKVVQGRAEVERLHQHHQQLLADNQNNPQPIRALFRVDGGFASQENIAWLIEMGYDVDTKARSPGVRDRLLAAVTDETVWQRVGGNATLTAWRQTTLDGAFVYPVHLALARYQTGQTVRHAVLVHYGDDEVTTDLEGWFHRYNCRQTIEAGIKEGKNVFQMHHLKVRSAPALLLQEHFACFAANFVRFAGLWLTQQQVHAPPFDTGSLKQMVQVCAHTSAWARQTGDGWLLTFTEQSLFAGYSLQVGFGAFQLPLPLFRNIQFCHF
jgi:hypothetical protein